MVGLVYIHIGDTLPECLIDSLYQTLLFNENKIYIILSTLLLDECKAKVNKFNIKTLINIEYVDISILQDKLSKSSRFLNYTNLMTTKFKNLDNFRNGFWVSTTSRFFYIEALMEVYNINCLFHIENDVMIYDNLKNFIPFICENNQSENNITMVQDAPNRVIPSILYFPNVKSIELLTKFIVNNLENSSTFMNDMDILGRFPYKNKFPVIPENNSFKYYNSQEKYIFDGAAIGQYLGGVDPRNLPNYDNNPQFFQYCNPTRQFINETSVFKPNTCKFIKKRVITDLNNNVNIFLSKNESSLYKIANLHIHSKQLYQFSSEFDYKFADIITGDRITGLCDFVICVQKIYETHKNLDKFAKDIIIIKDTGNVNFELLNKFFVDKFTEKNLNNEGEKKSVKLFLYSHMLGYFSEYILPKLNQDISYIIYAHNSDRSFNLFHKKIVDAKCIKLIYAQNIDYPYNTNKVRLLPIGIANSMWTHGDLYKLYAVMTDIYKYKKVYNIYINISENTYNYRKKLMKKIRDSNSYNISNPKQYKEYLYELAQNRFCLCIRGNGIDTHRFWESLYLGVIPVLINNNDTECKNFIKFIKKENIPFYEINENDLDIIITKYNDDFFNEELYCNIIKQLGRSIYSIEQTKMKYYKCN